MQTVQFRTKRLANFRLDGDDDVFRCESQALPKPRSTPAERFSKRGGCSHARLLVLRSRKGPAAGHHNPLPPFLKRSVVVYVT